MVYALLDFNRYFVAHYFFKYHSTTMGHRVDTFMRQTRQFVNLSIFYYYTVYIFFLLIKKTLTTMVISYTTNLHIA